MQEVLTRDILKKRIKNFFSQKRNDLDFSLTDNLYGLYFRRYLFHADHNGVEVNLDSTEWKTYLYLMKCVFDHRDFYNIETEGDIPQEYRNPHELKEIIQFLEDETKYGAGKTKSTNKQWLSARLMDDQNREEDELWGSGEHEWLLRSLIVEVLKRSAGTYYPNIQAFEEPHCMFSSFDWLMAQAELRTKTKYIFHKNVNNSLENGHAGAMKKTPGHKGFVTVGSKGFHDKLVEAFNESTTIAGFLTRVKKIIKTAMVSGEEPINPSRLTNFLVDGTKTNDLQGIEEFRTNKLYPDGYAQTRLNFWSAEQRISHYGRKNVENSAEASSDSDEEKVGNWMSSSQKF